jgi:uncharacterized protein YjiS (DUF1127 family)
MASEIGRTQKGVMVASLVDGHHPTAAEFNEREGTMATASVQTIETFTRASPPDLSSANPRTRSGLATVLAGWGPSASRKAPITWPTKLSSTISLWCARSRQRRALANLIEPNSHLLYDIGVTPDQASREAAKWFWQT